MSSRLPTATLSVRCSCGRHVSFTVIVVNDAAGPVNDLIALVNNVELSTSRQTALDNELAEGSGRLMGSVAPPGRGCPRA
jgi:hypothetical protein